MLVYRRGDIFNSKAQILVNPVNTWGIMGAGLAEKFKERFPPAMFESYLKLCQSGRLIQGKPAIWNQKIGQSVIFFPTKGDWHKSSELRWIAEGLVYFADKEVFLNGRSVAFPKVGCGLGGLDFESQVKPLMDRYLSNLDSQIEVYI